MLGLCSIKLSWELEKGTEGHRKVFELFFRLILTENFETIQWIQGTLVKI